MRRGECLGIRWANVDLEPGTLTVSESLAQTHKGGVFGKTTKTGRERTVGLSENTIRELRIVKAQQEVTKKAYPDIYQDNDLVCCNEDGSRIVPDVFSSEWHNIRVKAGIKHITFHDLRHSHATLMYHSTRDLKAVSERLGHSTITITGDLYVHGTPDRKCAEAVDAFVQFPDRSTAGGYFGNILATLTTDFPGL